MNGLLAAGTLVLLLATVGLVSVLFVKDRAPEVARIAGFVRAWAFSLGALVAFAAFALSLWYSYGVGYPPCDLCWFQRTMLYPLVILLPLAAWRRDAFIADYVIALSAVGGMIALYQHLLQTIGLGVLPCPSIGGDCAQRFIFEYGFVTMPLMAFAVCAFIIVLMLFVRSKWVESSECFPPTTPRLLRLF